MGFMVQGLGWRTEGSGLQHTASIGSLGSLRIANLVLGLRIKITLSTDSLPKPSTLNSKPYSNG